MKSMEVPEGHKRGSKRSLLGRWWVWLAGGVVVAAAGVGAYAWSQYHTLTSSKYKVVSYTVPVAPHLVARWIATWPWSSFA